MSQSQPEFPLWALPFRVLLFVVEVSHTLGIEPAVIAGPCLATLAGCIGNQRRIVVNPGSWTEPAILWIVLVMPSGAKKTPALSFVLGPLQTREATEIEEEQARWAEFEEAMDAWNSSPPAQRGTKPEKPKPAPRHLVSDITTEGLLALHARNPRGLLVHRDELGGWLRSFDQYRGGRQGADSQVWCEVHQGHPALVDRKGARTVSVPRAAVSIVGGIQPALLRDALQGEHLFDGLAARLLFIAPEEQLKTWTEATIGDETKQGWANLLHELLGLNPYEEVDPVDLPMTPQAKSAWIRYYDEHAEPERETKGPLRSALSKLEGATARLALILQLADDPESTEVGIDAMKAGIAISEWFEDQAERVYRAIDVNQAQQERLELTQWISNRGGATTTRELSRCGPNKFRKRAKEALEDLEAAGFGKKMKSLGKKEGRFVLIKSGTQVGGRR